MILMQKLSDGFSIVASGHEEVTRLEALHGEYRTVERRECLVFEDGYEEPIRFVTSAPRKERYKKKPWQKA